MLYTENMIFLGKELKKYPLKIKREYKLDIMPVSNSNDVIVFIHDENEIFLEWYRSKEKFLNDWGIIKKGEKNG